MPAANDARLLNVYEPPKLPGKKLRMSSNWKSKPPFSLCAPRAQVTVSATCQRLIVVSRGLNELRPMVSTSVPPERMFASGTSLLAKPGSRSRANWKRTSLKRREPSTDVMLALNVRV